MLNNLFLTWSPPSFYSDDIPQGTITTYHVYVKSKDGSVIVDDNTTNTFYNKGFSNNFTICDIYTVIVAAFTQQYKSIDVAIEYTCMYILFSIMYIVYHNVL